MGILRILFNYFDQLVDNRGSKINNDHSVYKNKNKTLQLQKYLLFYFLNKNPIQIYKYYKRLFTFNTFYCVHWHGTMYNSF